jgi:16S rRNA (cytidine1402-2'-O)-methyltransferase
MTTTEAPVGRLVVCPTPIGNLEDVTLRVLAALRDADVVACEDTRHTKLLLDRHGISARLVSFHEHNERARAAELVARIGEGAVVALVSDAGTPLVSDPGFALVRECLAAGLALEVLPGPSAMLTALVASGLPAERWRFVGFLPRKSAERERLLERAEETLVAFESPRRLANTLSVLAERDPVRPLAVCRELTKVHEEVRRGSAAELAEHYRENPARGEVVVVVGAVPPGHGARAEALVAVTELVEAGVRVRTAAAIVAKLTGGGANDLYRQLTGGAEQADSLDEL